MAEHEVEAEEVPRLVGETKQVALGIGASARPASRDWMVKLLRAWQGKKVPWRRIQSLWPGVGPKVPGSCL